jgi:hypothetical protein
MFSSELHDLL